MILELEYRQIAAFPIEEFEKIGQIRASAVVTHVLKGLRSTRVEAPYGYFLSMTKLISIGNPELKISSFNPKFKYIVIPVRYCLRSFLPTSGETLIGTVRRVLSNGALLKCGPMDCIFIHTSKMPSYKYVEGDEPRFEGEDLSRIQKGVVVCFKVFDVKWSESGIVKKDFKILATVDGDSLGPVSLAGSDEIDFIP